MHGVVPPQVQDPALALVEPHQVPLCPTLQPVQVLLNGSTAFRCTGKLVVLTWYTCMDRLDFSHDSILLHVTAILSSQHAYSFCKAGCQGCIWMERSWSYWIWNTQQVQPSVSRWRGKNSSPSDSMGVTLLLKTWVIMWWKERVLIFSRNIPHPPFSCIVAVTANKSWRDCSFLHAWCCTNPKMQGSSQTSQLA